MSLPIFFPLGIPPTDHTSVLIIRPIVKGKTPSKTQVYAESAVYAGAIETDNYAIRNACPIWLGGAIAFDTDIVGG
eukprot:CAMPEP_0202017656 /NCGR_PEP_ID=MMETSP0905-20130828/37600_1 /ASSEMBLY_ACC=CAM_ASM_000554 /TAXON_ID=420261 /ORGANISM="Thalassiosira antarctica, Strain CCMP982" /LENGTH=75 /DNA_ID=CAMNT_0048578383 /DNA_START=238 /DNA_END=465 /DNA_ORIENTATION=+